MQMKRIWGTAFAVLLSFTPALFAQQQSIVQITARGTTTLGGPSSLTVVPQGTTNEMRPSNVVNRQIPHSALSPARISASHVPNPAPNTLATSNPGFSGFNGISHRDQRFAGTGSYSNTQFSLEPPDQALCVGNGNVLESVNTALAVYDTGGTKLSGPEPINQFFKLAPEVIRSNPPVFGDFTSDPKCYFDIDNGGHFFFTVVQLDLNPSDGNFSGRSHLELAVSQTNDPTGMWNLFSIDVTNDGHNGTPAHPGCPCLGDQPLIGADANGFYISTNEFPIFANGFNGAQIYALSKTALEAGTLPTAVLFNTGTISTPDPGGIWFSVQPATTPPGDTFATNTEYFLSSLDFSGTLDNRIAFWTLTGTNTLDTTPNLALTPTVITTEIYGQPPAAQQKDGPRPLGQITIPQLGGKTEKLELLNSDDDRMESAVFAAGKVYGALTTVVKTPNGPARIGIAFFVVNPSNNTIAKQGYVSINQEFVFYPSVGVNSSGQGMLSFTFVGPDFFPSAAYTSLSATSGAGDVHIGGPGALPEDGFTGYSFFGGNRVARWGDYSAAAVDESGKLWLATEYIPNAPRSVLADWGSFVSNVIP
jgi:hypothetical protein